MTSFSSLAVVFVAAMFVAASTLFSASVSATEGPKDGGFFVPRPAWSFDSKVSTSTTDYRFQIGTPFAGSEGPFGFVIGGSYSLNSGNTTVCVFDAMTNGTCVNTIVVLSGFWKIDNIVMANRVDGYIFDARDTSTGFTATFRWNSLVGLEWWHPRGAIAPRNTFVVDSKFNTFVSTEATADGKTEAIVGAATLDHKYVQFWSTSLPIPAGNQSAWKSYARDLTWFYPRNDVPVVGLISLGRVFAISTDNGTVLKEVDAPCGYASTEFHMVPVKIKFTEIILLVYGNVANHGFVVCALTLNSNLTQLWSVQVGEQITPANGDQSLSVIRTSFDNGFFPIAVDQLYIAGTKHGNKNESFLWCFSVQNASLAWELPRKYADRFNMPMFIGGAEDEHIAVTVNGTMTGLNPVTQNQKWSCNYTSLGCQGTPAVFRLTSGELGRMICVSAASDTQVIALSVSKTNNNFCKLAWQTTLPTALDVRQQNTPAMVTSHWTPLEPFVAILTSSGTVWTLSLRSDVEPAPTAAPTAPPTPAPTLPPANVPQPLYKYVTQAPYEFSDVVLRNSPSVAPFSEQGPVVAAVAECNLFLTKQLLRQGKENRQALKYGGESAAADGKTTVGLGSLVTVFYFQSIPLGKSATMDYSYVSLPMNYFVHSPISVFYGAGQYVAAAAEENGDGDVILLYTYPNTQNTGNDVAGRYEFFGRYGAYSRAATDGTGYLYYTIGVTNNYYEYVFCKVQRGAGYDTQFVWTKKLGDNVTRFTNLTVHTGDLTFAFAGNNGYVFFSYLNALYVANALTGADAVPPVKNPCNFQPSTNSWEKYYPMNIYWAHTGKENLALAVVDTWDQYGDETYGLCGFNLSSSANLATTYGILLRNVSYISAIQAVGSSNLFAIDAQDDDWKGTMMVFDASSGQKLYTQYRSQSYGSDIVAVPGSDLFITNADSMVSPQAMVLALLDARTGSALGLCDVGCEYFTLTRDSKNVWTVICAVEDFLQIVRALQFIPSSSPGAAGNTYTCNTTWEADVGDAVRGMSNEDADISVDGNRYVIISLVTGLTVSLSPDAGALPTPVPPIPTGFAHPQYAVTMNLSTQWLTPRAIVPTVADLGSFDFNYGPVAFGAVDAGTRSASENFLAVGDGPRRTVVLGYQSQVPVGKIVYDNVYVELDETTMTWDPVWIGRTTHRNAAAFATRNGIGYAVVIAFPVTSFSIPRFGAYSFIATDGAGRIFFSIGASGNVEQFVCYQLSADGNTLTKLWSIDVKPPGGVNVPNFTSHIGNPTYSTGRTGQGFISFSSFDTIYTLNADTGADVVDWLYPCGFTPPADPFNDNTPYPMSISTVSLANNTVVVANIIPIGPDALNGYFGICTTSFDDQATLWSAQLNLLPGNAVVVENILSTTDVVGTNFFVLDIKTQPNGKGVMVGFDATSGNFWVADRTRSSGTPPAAQAFAGQYMVANWDDPNHFDSFLSLVNVTTGVPAVQCSWSCRSQPVAASVMIGNSLASIFVCAMDEHPNVVRAVQFKQIDGQAGYTCETFWEYTLDENSLVVSPAGKDSIAIGLASGAVASLALTASNAPITPVPQESTPAPEHKVTTPRPDSPQVNPGSGPAPNNGMSGGVVAAIVILVLLAAVIGVGGIYLIRRRNVRRSALSEASAGMEYDATSRNAGSSTDGYGAIA